MRLHRLRLRAFGPFPDEVEVDVDALARGGLFLLHGPTGAGKTSLLDAVCFALYGRVPGDRARVLGGLRSDHAAPGVVPEVACEFTVGSRRFEVVRSPQWERPKRRGSGTVTEPARVRVTELTGGELTVLSTRLDEAGDLVHQVLGLGPEQFTKLILLPQGDFAAFLRSDAESRRRLLEKLFHTDRFAQVQSWLADRRVESGRTVAAARAHTAALLARAGQAVSPLGLPAGGSSAQNPSSPTGPADLDVLVEETRRVLAQARRERRRAEQRLRTARETCAAAAELAHRQEAHAALLRRAEQLAVQAAARDEAQDRLRAADQARTIAPLILELEHLAATADRAAARLTELGDTPDGRHAEGRLDDAALAEHVQRLTRTLGDLDAVQEDAAELADGTRTLERLEAEVDQARAAVRAGVQRGEDAARRRDEIAEQLSAARLVAAGAEAANAAVEAARRLVDAVRRRDLLAAETARAAAVVGELRDRRETARETWLDLREARLEGIAAELAVALVAGEPCRVCGSARHPEPAVAHGRAVTEADEAAARRAVDDADTELTAAQDRHTGLAARHAAAEAEACGATPEDAEAALRAAHEDLTRATAAQKEVDRLVRALAACEDDVAAAAAEVTARRDRLEAAVPEAERLRARLGALGERVDRARGDHPTVAARRAAVTAELARCTELVEARAAAAAARSAYERARPAALEAVTRAGFAGLVEAAVAVLEEPEVARLRSLVADHDAEVAAVHDRLADPALAEAAGLPRADVDAAAAQLQVAESADEAAAHRLALATAAAEQVAQIRAALAAHLAETGPLEAEHQMLDAVSRCADGTHPDNTRRMSLSSYVLAARLEQVAAAASEHLARMSGGRYLLAHSDAKERGGARSGLGLTVVDCWTGRRRETATLSGGETFYTSLALALGLADVVTRETGGLTLETLFVDEGFGSLDEETLDEVMDVLDDLRSGGRTVGVVSHVPDLRLRLPHRLEVVKGRNGSWVRGVPDDGPTKVRERR